MIQKSIIKVKALTLTIKNNNKQKIFLIKKILIININDFSKKNSRLTFQNQQKNKILLKRVKIVKKGNFLKVKARKRSIKKKTKFIYRNKILSLHKDQII
jgi:hypothetical protein